MNRILMPSPRILESYPPPMWHIAYRDDILQAAEMFVAGLPKSRKAVKDVLTTKRKAYVEDDVSRSHKRQVSGTTFTIAEDAEQSEEVADMPKDELKNTSIDPPITATNLSATTLNKLNAFRYKPETCIPSQKFKLYQTVQITASPQDTDRAPTNEHPKDKQRLPNADVTEVEATVCDSNKFGVAHLDGYLVEKHRWLLKKLHNNQKTELIARPATNPTPALKFDIKNGHKMATPESKAGSSDEDFEDEFEEDDTIFEQLIANDEADNHPILRTPNTSKLHGVPFSTPTPLAAAMTPPPLVFDDTPPALIVQNMPSKIFTPPTPLIKPFFRAILPSPAPENSLIPNMNPALRIPTCFRIGEAVRLLSPTSKTTYRAIELYAIVTSSFRKEGIQNFQFADLYFPQRPPYLNGTYACYTDSEIYDQDSASFLSTPNSDTKKAGGGVDIKMCRAIIRPTQTSGRFSGWNEKAAPTPSLSNPLSRTYISSNKNLGNKDSREHVAVVEILNIWKCDWDDIGYVKGIVMEQVSSPTSPKNGTATLSG